MQSRAPYYRCPLRYSRDPQDKQGQNEESESTLQVPIKRLKRLARTESRIRKPHISCLPQPKSRALRNSQDTLSTESRERLALICLGKNGLKIVLSKRFKATQVQLRNFRFSWCKETEATLWAYTNHPTSELWVAKFGAHFRLPLPTSQSR